MAERGRNAHTPPSPSTSKLLEHVDGNRDLYFVTARDGREWWRESHGERQARIRQGGLKYRASDTCRQTHFVGGNAPLDSLLAYVFSGLRGWQAFGEGRREA